MIFLASRSDRRRCLFTSLPTVFLSLFYLILVLGGWWKVVVDDMNI